MKCGTLTERVNVFYTYTHTHIHERKQFVRLNANRFEHKVEIGHFSWKYKLVKRSQGKI